jgi:hypothetical protein
MKGKDAPPSKIDSLCFYLEKADNGWILDIRKRNKDAYMRYSKYICVGADDIVKHISTVILECETHQS